MMVLFKEKTQKLLHRIGTESLIFGGIAAMVLFSSVMVVAAAAHDWVEPVNTAAATMTTANSSVTPTALPLLKAAEETTTTTSYLHEAIPVDSFTVANLAENVTSELDYVDWFYSQYDECRYLCLPSSADRSALMISYCSLAPS